jgi:hypothetical protein
MKWIRTFEEMIWDEPSFKKVEYDDFSDSPFPKDLSLDEKDMVMIDNLSKELDFIYSKAPNKRLLITCYSEKFGNQIMIWKNNADDEMYFFSESGQTYEVDGRDSLEHLIRESLKKSPAAPHIKFTVQELSLLKKLSREFGCDFKVPNKVSMFSKRFNSRFIIWKVSDNLYRLGFSQRVYSFQNLMELIKKIREFME